MSWDQFGVIGPCLEKCLDQVKKLLETSGPILLIGEPGCGKDFFAKIIHFYLTEKTEKNFQIQNCSRPQEILLEELFGRVNANDSNLWDNVEVLDMGKLDAAAQGTLYLDHIHLISQNAADIIETIISNQPFYPKGSSTPRLQDNIRIIASCNPHPFDGELGYLPQKIRVYFKDRFVVLPNLAQRKQEIPDIISYLCKKEFQAIVGSVPVFEIEQEFIDSADTIFDNLKGLIVIIKHFVNQNPQGGKITHQLASEYIKWRIGQQSVDDQCRYRCEQMSHNLRYQGKLLNGDKLYSWLMQFDQFQGQITNNPINIGENLLKHICERYFFTEAKIVSLLESMQNELISDIKENINNRRTETEKCRFAPEYLSEKSHQEAIQIASQLVVTAPLCPRLN